MQTVMQAAQPYMPVAHLHDHRQGSDLHLVRSCYHARVSDQAQLDLGTAEGKTSISTANPI